MIPKVIHYCWFGHGKKSKLILDCIKSWEVMCPDFEIKEWTEENFPVENFTFTKKVYKEKRWAFVSDYARLHILEQHGGFYLDTDMLLVQSLTPLLNADCVLGEEAPGTISAGMVAAEAHHPFIVACRKYYDENSTMLVTIPRVLTKIYNEYSDKDRITVYPPKAFYPFDSHHIKEYRGQDLGESTYGVHLWNYSWGHPLNKFIKKIGIHSFGTEVVEYLGIKEVLKKLLGFI